MPEGLSASEVGKEIAEHREHVEHRQHAAESSSERDRVISIIEALLLSLVALMAAWSGYSAAKWGTESSLSLAKASSKRSAASVNEVQATQIRTLDSVSYNTIAGAYVAHDKKLFDLGIRRLRPGARTAFRAWLALHPLTNPRAPADPSSMPQYRVPQASAALALGAQATAYFNRAESDAGTGDKYVRLTVVLAAVLFLVGIGSRFPMRPGRYGLIGVAGVLFVLSVVQLLALPGPPA